MTVPPEAIAAAAQAIGASIGRGEPSEVIATRALEAAAPHIEAAERDRIRQHAMTHRFTLHRPGMGNGPEHGQSIDVVPLASLLEAL